MPYHVAMDYSLPLQGRVAVVIGSATGIGAATARGLGRRGASVLLADIDHATAERRAEEIREQGGDAVACACDVGDETQVRAALDEAVRRWGGLDVLHNNAAAMQLVRDDGLIADASADHWDATLRINLRGQMLGCKHAIPHLIQRGGGSIINTASVSGMLGDLVASAYGAAKAGVEQLTRTVATQNGRFGIRCNAVIPGLIQVDRPAGTGMAPERRRLLQDHQALPVAGQADDVADVVAFLAGDDSRFVTGHSLIVDGGLSIHMPTFADVRRAEG